MSEVRNLISQIREYENHASYARKTNEKELPNLKFLVSDIEKFGFGKEDLDLKQRMLLVSENIQSLETVGIKAEVIEEYRQEVSSILNTLLERYRERMEAYASRQSNL